MVTVMNHISQEYDSGFLLTLKGLDEFFVNYFLKSTFCQIPASLDLTKCRTSVVILLDI